MSEFIDLPNGLRVHVQQQGSGSPVLCIPGWAYPGEVFQATLDSLAANGYRAIVCDPRGQGRSGKTEAPNTYRQHGKDLHLLIEALGLDRLALVGWSLGVYDILCYLEQEGPGRVTSLVLVDESPKIVREAEDDWGEGVEDEVAGLVSMVATDAYLPFFRDYMAAGFDKKPAAEVLDRFTKAASVLSPEEASELLGDARSYDFRKLLSELDRKLPILQILRDEWAEQAKKWLSTYTPGSRVEILGGHLMLMEYPEIFNQLLLEFLGKTHS